MTDILLGDEFVKEYPNFPPNLQNAIVDFIYLVERYGFDHAVFCHYKGKISPSWRNLSPTDPNYTYTNHLWHYHTSDMVLHFIWHKKQDSIIIVDCTDHYRYDKSFWLPAPQYLIASK